MSNMLNEYVKRPTDRKSELAEVMDRRQNEKVQELDNIKLDAMIAEEKKKLREASPTQIDSTQATNFIATIFAGKTPAEIKEILRSFTQEEIDKLTYIAKSMTQNNFLDPRGFPSRESNNEVKNMLEALKIGLEAGRKNDNNGISTKDLLDALKTGAELSRAQQPPVQQQQDPLTFYKAIQGIVQPIQESASKHEKELNDLRLQSIESKIVNPTDYIKNVKAMSAELGLSSGGKTDIDLRLEEMRQNKDLETQKIDWEKEKWKLDKEKEGSTLETVKEILAGPAGEALKIIGAAGADRIRGNKASNSNSQVQSAQIGQVKCPNCAGVFPANIELSMLQCPLCGKQLQNSNIPTTQQEQTQVPAPQPAPEPTQQPSEEPKKDEPYIENNPKVEPVVEKPADKQ